MFFNLKMNLPTQPDIRHKNIIKTAWIGLITKVISNVVSFLMVPLALNYLGKEQYGLWIAISSLMAMLGFMDGGVGNAVINLVAQSKGQKDNELPKIVSTAFFCLMALALLSGSLFLVVFPYISWNWLLGFKTLEIGQDIKFIIIIAGLFLFFNMFITLIGKIQQGLQEGSLDNIWICISSVLSLLAVHIAIQKDTGFIGFVAAFLGGAIISYILSNIHYLFFSRKDLMPSIRLVDVGIAKNLFKVGGMFFVLQIAATIQNQADNVIIANMIGAEAVTVYAVCMKLFLTVPMALSLLLTPLWPAYREAFVSGDTQWVRRIYLKSMQWSLLVSIPSAIVLLMVGENIISIWVGQESVPSFYLLIGCSIWLVFTSVGNALAVFLNGLQLVRVQVIIATASGIINILLSVWLIPIMGVAGPIFGSVISYLFFTLIPYFFIIRKMLVNPVYLK